MKPKPRKKKEQKPILTKIIITNQSNIDWFVSDKSHSEVHERLLIIMESKPDHISFKKGDGFVFIPYNYIINSKIEIK
jgi:hypothetical protein